MTKLVFLDTETTSLRPDRRAWEIGLIVRDPDCGDIEHHWFVDADDLDLANADVSSLRIGGFYQRHPQANGADRPMIEIAEAEEVAWQIEELTRDAVIVGAVPNFDTETLAAMLRRHNDLPAWHYHLVDVETLAAGALRKPPPWGFDDLLADYGLAYAEEDRHTALGDARMARDLYDAVLGGARDRAE